jgi:hypothetical protein
MFSVSKQGPPPRDFNQRERGREGGEGGRREEWGGRGRGRGSEKEERREGRRGGEGRKDNGKGRQRGVGREREATSKRENQKRLKKRCRDWQ